MIGGAHPRMPALARSWVRSPVRLAAMPVALLAMTSAVQAQDTNVDIQVNVIRPARLALVDDMLFGSVIAGPDGGTVTLDPESGNCSTTGSAVEVGTCQASVFTGFGPTQTLLRVRVKQESIILTGPGADMIVDDFTMDFDPDLAFVRTQGKFNIARIISASGAFDLRIGATLTVNANQAPGTYSGTYRVQIQYQ